MLKVISKKEYERLKQIECYYDTEHVELERIRNELQQEESFGNKVKRKLCKTNAVIYDIKKDRDNINTYVCVQDLRKPVLRNVKDVFLEGDLNIFVMNKALRISDSFIYTETPFVQARFKEKDIYIYEIRSSLNGMSYENKGYGTMMFQTLIDLGKKSKCTSIKGMLSVVDCATNEKRDKRNRFYEKNGCELFFSDERKENGKFILKLDGE